MLLDILALNLFYFILIHFLAIVYLRNFILKHAEYKIL